MMLFRWLLRQEIDQATELKRLRYEIEQLKKDAVARGVLLNEVYQLVKKEGEK
jgi:hypothetical protein